MLRADNTRMRHLVANSRYWGNRSKIVVHTRSWTESCVLGQKILFAPCTDPKELPEPRAGRVAGKAMQGKAENLVEAPIYRKNEFLYILMSVVISAYKWNWNQGERDIFGCPAAGKTGVCCSSTWWFSIFHLCSAGCVAEGIFVQMICWEGMG